MLTVCFLLFEISKSRTFQFFGEIINKVDTKEKVVALTFDDAPSENIEDVLKILSEKNIKATFYVIGENIEKYPEQMKNIISQGNDVGNHSYSHKRMILKSYYFIKNEVEKTNQLIKNFGYKNEITFRPPNGKKLLELPYYLYKNSTKTIMWNIEPDTYYQGDSEKIAKYILDNVTPGSIILLHPFCGEKCSADVEALPKIIDELTANGYKFLTINELLKY